MPPTQGLPSLGEPDPEEEGTKFHEMAEAGIAKGLTGMVVVPFTAFLEKGTIPRRSYNNMTNVHVSVSELTDKDRIIFFSQRWLTPSPKELASPDGNIGGWRLAAHILIHATL